MLQIHNPLSPGKNILSKFSLNSLFYFAIKSTVLSLFSIHYSEDCFWSLTASQPFSIKNLYSLTWQYYPFQEEVQSYGLFVLFSKSFLGKTCG